MISTHMSDVIIGLKDELLRKELKHGYKRFVLLKHSLSFYLSVIKTLP